ncbi:hypothetical protein BAUCODRAFT_191208 [Baudoinia panamericana UAMH 10762]|uniref:Uncharacterized protein n=1 Tax=Baudoinia panamericana (strain UAMH 10762) TaxID=717646 RepID=M2NND2_BAUPA|nr:uncharacterized protein BAUCODRAFT_191208 [Baudoinia panamericana UAMH 10762]EMD00995.1 hypothetical protein BAUCODRAFT_191208 [Baudoinia panamericana UAMH 10762]
MVSRVGGPSSVVLPLVEPRGNNDAATCTWPVALRPQPAEPDLHGLTSVNAAPTMNFATTRRDDSILIVCSETLLLKAAGCGVHTATKLWSSAMGGPNPHSIPGQWTCEHCQKHTDCLIHSPAMLCSAYRSSYVIGNNA